MTKKVVGVSCGVLNGKRDTRVEWMDISGRSNLGLLISIILTLENDKGA